MYRPKGWETIKQAILKEPNGMDKWCCSTCADKVVEATADAMLEGLRANTGCTRGSMKDWSLGLAVSKHWVDKNTYNIIIILLIFEITLTFQRKR